MIYPAPGYCLVELIEDSDTTTDGVYVSGDRSSDQTTAKVLLIGRAGDMSESFVYPPEFLVEDGDKVRVLQLNDIIIYRRNRDYEITEPGQKTRTAFLAFNRILGLII